MPSETPTNRELREVHTLTQLVSYLKHELGWPVAIDDFDELDGLTFDWGSEELGIDSESAAKIDYIKQLRPLEKGQPKGVFFVKFDTRQLPVVALRRVLGKLVVKKRIAASAAERPLWEMRDLVFISSFGESDERQLSFAYFQDNPAKKDLPTLKVLGWDNRDTPMHLDTVDKHLREHLSWPVDRTGLTEWRGRWSEAFQLRHKEVITTAKALAVRLAELARAIRNRIRTVLAIENEHGPITKLMKAFQTALIHDLSAEGFADMYAQTIAYGLLSARVTNPKANTADDFASQLPVTNPFLRELMETFVHAGGRKRGSARAPAIDFDELGVSEVVELLDDANMEAVVRDFGDKNPHEDPVIHFYEDFLQEYDPDQKKQLGVFYTPRPVVAYIVRALDELLRAELGLPDGLAETTSWGEMAKRNRELRIPGGVSPEQAFVQVLDPATGTGTFLVEVIALIHKTLVEKWKSEGHGEAKMLDLWNDYVPMHLLPRVHGYELLMAPYAIAHLKIGLKLYETGYRFGSAERLRIYLTNALEPAHDFAGTLAFAIPALAHEAEAVADIKRRRRFTVVLGNPPYARHSSNPNRRADGTLTFIGRLVEDYKEGCPELRKPAQAKYLQDDYVKFTRFSEQLLLDSGIGALGLITNHGFLDNPTFRGLRNHLLERFARLDVLDLHGNANKKERSPDGSDDKNVFDIKQGVAILLGVVPRENGRTCKVLHGDLWGSRETKYSRLGASVARLSTSLLSPSAPQFSLRPRDVTNEMEYDAFPSVGEMFAPNGAPAPGIVTTHDSFAVAFTRDELVQNVETLLESRNENEAREHFRLCSQAQWNYKIAKRELADGGWRSKIIPLHYRPFDTRFTVYDSNVAVHRRERVTRHLVGGGNIAMLTSRMTKGESFRHVQVTRLVPEVICMSPLTSNNGFVFPLWLKPNAESAGGPGRLFRETRYPNLGREFLLRLGTALGLQPKGAYGLPGDLTPEDIFNYAYASFHSPGFRSRYAEFLKADFPRVPLPGGQPLFRELARIGAELVRLHLMESPVLDRPITVYSGPSRPAVGRVGWSDETVWLDAVAARKGQSTAAGTVGFRGVPRAVWEFQIGGYQVCEKWLKDRKGRKLLKDDLAHYQRIVVAVAETIRLMNAIDGIVDAHGGWPGAFSTLASQVRTSGAQLSLVAEPETGYDGGTT